MKLIEMSLLGAMLSLALVGCASTNSEPKAASVAQNDRQVYADYIEKKLDALEDQNSHLQEPHRKTVETSIKDARIELELLQNSTNPNWESYRSRLDGAVAKIERDQFNLNRKM